MPEESPIISELRELLDLDADQGLEPPKAERLAQILSEHPETLDFYIEYTDQTAALQRTSGQNLSIGDGLVTSIEEGLDNHDRRGQFNYWKPWLDNHVNTITSSILNEGVPPRPTDVPQYICSGCTYLDLCNRNANHNE